MNWGLIEEVGRTAGKLLPRARRGPVVAWAAMVALEMERVALLWIHFGGRSNRTR